MMRTVLALTIVLFCCGPVPAQAPEPEGPFAPVQQPADDVRLDGLDKPEPEQQKADDSWWQKVLRDAPNCKTFTDGCRTCTHTVCSNIGIACQPKEWSCSDPVDTAPDAKPEANPDAKPDTKPDQKP